MLNIIKSFKGKLVALTGAGISADSGIPTFRGKDGLWNRYRPEELATFEAFSRNPKLVWEWYSWRMEKIFAAKPNKAHEALALLEKKGLLKAVITQNVDNLHERAGSKNVIHLHGRIDKGRCLECGNVIKFEKPPKGIPKCECGGIIRPNVVWFGEPLPERELKTAVDLCSRNNVIVIGTSAVVQPAASLPLFAKRNGYKIIEVNPDETPLSSLCDYIVRKRAAEAFEAILKGEDFQ